jgi:hypothetical protein
MPYMVLILFFHIEYAINLKLLKKPARHQNSRNYTN